MTSVMVLLTRDFCGDYYLLCLASKRTSKDCIRKRSQTNKGIKNQPKLRNWKRKETGSERKRRGETRHLKQRRICRVNRIDSGH
jgi:hypothetical protein